MNCYMHVLLLIQSINYSGLELRIMLHELIKMFELSCWYREFLC